LPNKLSFGVEDRTRPLTWQHHVDRSDGAPILVQNSIGAAALLRGRSLRREPQTNSRGAATFIRHGSAGFWNPASKKTVNSLRLLNKWALYFAQNAAEPLSGAASAFYTSMPSAYYVELSLSAVERKESHLEESR